MTEEEEDIILKAISQLLREIGDPIIHKRLLKIGYAIEAARNGNKISFKEIIKSD